MRFERRGEGKRVVAPDGSGLAPINKPQPDGTLVKALARARRRPKLPDAGVDTPATAIAEAEGINKSDTSRIRRLALLAPDIVEAVLDGRLPKGMRLEDLVRPLPADWAGQRRALAIGGAGNAERSIQPAPTLERAPARPETRLRRRPP